MIKVKWDLSEAIVLMAEYFEASSYTAVSDRRLSLLSEMYKKKAVEAGIKFDEKFRNITGLKMQLACIHYIVTNGHEGMANASKVFYQAYELYQNSPQSFANIRNEFLNKFGIERPDFM